MSVWSTIDDVVKGFYAENKTTVDKLNIEDYKKIIPLLIQAMESKLLPSLDSIDPDKQIFVLVAEYLISKNPATLEQVVMLIVSGLASELSSKVASVMQPTATTTTTSST